MTTNSQVFGLSHTLQDESDMVQDTSTFSKILTVSEGSMNVPLLSSFRTQAPAEALKQKPFGPAPLGACPWCTTDKTGGGRGQSSWTFGAGDKLPAPWVLWQLLCRNKARCCTHADLAAAD